MTFKRIKRIVCKLVVTNELIHFLNIGKIKKQDLEEHEMITLAYRVSELDRRLHEVPQLVKGLHDYYIKTRYPDYQRHSHDISIPAEKYTEENAEQAIAKAMNIYELIKDVLGPWTVSG